ncbi:hypothetical protein BBJ28_00010549 [Nothophytophthora sp. Chile5]|nr:hypothetical protein BBJ28_00010549 [Nothophytophthora sp. Chile5]
MEDDASRDAEYPEGYEDSNYADYYQSEIEGTGNAYDAAGQQEARDPTYYDAWYQQQGDSDAYHQQEGQEEAAAAATSDVYAAGYDYANGYDYQHGYDATAYDPTTSGDDQYYGYYPGGEGNDAEQQSYVNADHPPTEQQYVDQVARDQAAGYYYDEEGNLIDGYGGSESPTNVFKQEAYWELEAYNQTDTSYTGEATSPEIEGESPQDELSAEERGRAEASPIETDNDGLESSPGLEQSPGKVKNPVKDGRAKSKKERMQQRQALLEKEEEERLKAQGDLATAGGTDNKPGEVSKAATKAPTKISGFINREKTKFQMRVRIAKAIRRKRMPVQIRILTATRKHLTPLEKYFDSSSIECALSDIFWASMKGDLRRDLYVQDYDVRRILDLCSDVELAGADNPILLTRFGCRGPFQYEDSLWLPKFVDDLIRGIVRYKIKLFKDPPKKLSRAAAKAAAVDAAATAGAPPIPGPATPEAVKTGKSPEDGTSPVADGSSATVTPLKRVKSEKAKRTPGRGDQKAAPATSLR